jgi:hypothetical protein
LAFAPVLDPIGLPKAVFPIKIYSLHGIFVFPIDRLHFEQDRLAFLFQPVEHLGADPLPLVSGLISR